MDYMEYIYIYIFAAHPTMVEVLHRKFIQAEECVARFPARRASRTTHQKHNQERAESIPSVGYHSIKGRAQRAFPVSDTSPTERDSD